MPKTWPSLKKGSSSLKLSDKKLKITQSISKTLSKQNIFTRRQPSFLLKVFVLVFVILLAQVSLIKPAKVEALTGHDIPDFFNAPPGGITPYDNGCSKRAEKYASYRWISEAGVPKGGNYAVVPYGTTSVPLWYNRLIFLCHDIVNVGDCKGGCPFYSSDGVPPGYFPTEGTPTSAAK